MFATIYAQVGFATLVGVFLLSLWKGETPERAGAGLNLLAGVLAMAADSALSSDLRPSIDLAIDGILATSFLLLAVRYASLWLGAAMLLQAAQFSLHAYYLLSDQIHDLRYAVFNNLITTGVNIAILAGILLAWRRRVRIRREEKDEAA